jgi:hypothetical protein
MDHSGALASVGEYVLLGELGRGGMGCVYRARHRATGAIRALKLVKGNVDAEALARLRREGEALARVGGEGVVPVHEAGADKGRPYLVMALMSGGSLRARLRAQGRLPWREAAALAVALARALGRCHAAGLVHRDVKPENVLFDDEGRPCLADFGATRDLLASTLTESGTAIGTPTYMAPEQLEGARVEAPADIYALGVLLHEAVTGAPPYPPAPSIYKLLADKVAARRKPVSDEVAGVPAGLDLVIARALAPKPEGRYPSADAMAADLEAVLAGGDAALRPRRPRWPVGLGVGAVALALGVAWLERRPAASPGPDSPVKVAPPPIAPRKPDPVPEATPDRGADLEKLIDRVASGATSWEEAEPEARTLAEPLTGERRREIAARWAARVPRLADARPRALCRFVQSLDREALAPAILAEALKLARERVASKLPVHLVPLGSPPDPQAELAFLDAAMFVAEEKGAELAEHDARLAGGLVNAIARLIPLNPRVALALARAALDDAERLDPGRAEARFVRGSLLAAEAARTPSKDFPDGDRRQRLRETIAAFKSAREIDDPAFDLGHRGWAEASMAMAHMQLDEHAAALALFDALATGSPEDRAVHDSTIVVISHARAAFELEQDSRAIQVLEAAARRPSYRAKFLELAAAVRNVSPATRGEVHDQLWQFKE